MKLKRFNLALTVSLSSILRLVWLTVLVSTVQAKAFDRGDGPLRKHQHHQKHHSHNYVSLKPFENSKLSSSSLLLAVNSENLSSESKSKQQLHHHHHHHYHHHIPQHPLKRGYLREKRRTTMSTGAFHSASLISADIKNKIMGTLAKNDSGEYTFCFSFSLPFAVLYSLHLGFLFLP